MNTMVIFKEVKKKYALITALDKLTFEVPVNSHVALIGNNGSGKTTVINILGNIIGYDDGEVMFNGRKIVPNYVSYKKDIGMVLSHPYYVSEFSVIQYWNLLGEFFKIHKEELDFRAESLLEALNIENKKSLKISELSSGDQMKVSIGGSLIHNPKLLLYDEPFVFLDNNSLDKVSEIIDNVSDTKTLLISSHNLDLVADLCDTFLIIDNGVIIRKILKTDYSNKAELKISVKKSLLSENRKINLQWLNS